LTYIDLIRADKACAERFGDDYKAYMKKVPRANFLLGIIRLLQRRKTEPKTET
jgi:protein-S-isoprenylcysteine O-methyltransferase Ste14